MCAFDVRHLGDGHGACRRRPWTACTSLLVRHRDPFDVGLSPAREPCGPRGRRTVADAGRLSDGMSVKRARASARPARRKAMSLPYYCRKCGSRCGVVCCRCRCLGPCASRSAMIQFRALAGPVLEHGPRSLACVRVIEIIKLKGATKVKARASRVLREDGDRSRSASRTPEASRFQSVNAGAL